MGNKAKIAKQIQNEFPPHVVYQEPFFGAGGMFFNKPKSKYNIVNDNDSDVFNLFTVLMNQKEELEEAFFKMPLHTDLLEFWKKNQEEEPLMKALRFLFLSNFTFMGAGNTLKTGTENPKKIFFNRIEKTFEMISDVQFLNCDFRRFFIEARINDPLKTFIYCDPPYVDTNDNYSSSFKKEDSFDLFECLDKTNARWAMSEFNNPFILDQAKKRNLNVIVLGERRNLENRQVEILVTNYENQQLNLF